MIVRKVKTLALAAAVAALVAACGQKAMPEVNDENCKPANVEKLADPAMQKEFSSKCLHRGGFTPSEPRKW